MQWPRMSVCGLSTAADHAPGHLRRLHPQLGVDARDDDVEPGEQRLVLVEGTVLEDVDLDAGQHAKRRHFLVQLRDHLQLAEEPLGVEAVRDREPRAVVGEDQVLVPEGGGGLGHLRGWGCRRPTSPSGCGSRPAAPP